MKKQFRKFFNIAILATGVGIYLYENVHLGKSVPESLPYFMLLVIVFLASYLGTLIGSIGIVLYSITKSEAIAIATLKLAVVLGGRTATILNSLGFLLLRRGDYVKSLTYFTEAEGKTNYFMLKKGIRINKTLSLW